MRGKFTLIAILTLICFGAFAQEGNSPFRTGNDTLPDGTIRTYDTLSSIPDTLIDKVDTADRIFVGQTVTADTLPSKLQVVPDENNNPVSKKFDRRWFVSPLLKFQAQEFGLIERQRRHNESVAHLLPFPDKSNISISASIYKNFTKNISMSADLGASMGHITSKDVLISATQKSTYFVSNATLYYHLLGGQYKLQPFIAAGINSVMNHGSYLTAPAGVGVKYTGKKIMMTAQGAYGYALDKKMANNLSYSLGVYIPFKNRKQQREEAQAEKQKADSSFTVTTNINNYYLLNNVDSIRKAVEDSIFNEIKKAEPKEPVQEEVDEDLDPDDPMRLPAARKYVIYFYYDQYSLTTYAFQTIDAVIAQLRDNKKLSVHLKGHTDMAGSEQYNAPLSKKRAQMVYDYMNSRGIPSERIILSSYGKKNPAVKNENPNTAWQNRRCELVLFESK